MSKLNLIQKFTVFRGRSSRRDFWMFALKHILFIVVVSVVGWYLLAVYTMRVAGNIPNWEQTYLIIIFSYLALLILPGLAVTIRRLHDTNRSGAWIFINLIPVIGQIIFFVFLIQASDEGQNKFGGVSDDENIKSA